MRAHLLFKLADLLEANADNPQGLSFDYDDFGYVNDPKVAPGMDCNTHACALGLAAISGQFPGLGFKLFDDCQDITITLDGSSTDGFYAATKVFDITVTDACFLFADVPLGDNRGADAEREVAKVIRWFAEGKNEAGIMIALGY